MVTFHTEGPPCVCGLRPRGVEVATVRVNRRSLKTQGWSLGGMPWHCRECGTWQGDDLTALRRWLDPADAAKVAAYRARRWPERGSESVPAVPAPGYARPDALSGPRGSETASRAVPASAPDRREAP